MRCRDVFNPIIERCRDAFNSIIERCRDAFNPIIKNFELFIDEQGPRAPNLDRQSHQKNHSEFRVFFYLAFDALELGGSTWPLYR